MSGLPEQVPQQSVPIAADAQGNPIFSSPDWWLWFYNLSVQVMGTGGGGKTPVSPSDALDMVNLLALGADVPQAYRGNENLAALLSLRSQPTDADVARLHSVLANALLLAMGALLPDPQPAAQPSQTITVGASPFTWTAPFNGTLSVTGGTVSAISLIRQGTAVAAGITVGLVPVRRNDQVKLTWSGLPTAVFLPA